MPRCVIQLGVRAPVLTMTKYRLVHAFRAPSDLVPRRSCGTKSRVREKHIPTDLVHGLHRKPNTFYTTPI